MTKTYLILHQLITALTLYYFIKGGSRVTQQSMEALETAAELIGVDSDELQQSLLSRVMQTSKGGHKVWNEKLNYSFIRVINDRELFIWYP